MQATTYLMLRSARRARLEARAAFSALIDFLTASVAEMTELTAALALRARQ